MRRRSPVRIDPLCRLQADRAPFAVPSAASTPLGRRRCGRDARDFRVRPCRTVVCRATHVWRCGASGGPAAACARRPAHPPVRPLGQLGTPGGGSRPCRCFLHRKGTPCSVHCFAGRRFRRLRPHGAEPRPASTRTTISALFTASMPPDGHSPTSPNHLRRAMRCASSAGVSRSRFISYSNMTCSESCAQAPPPPSMYSRLFESTVRAQPSPLAAPSSSCPDSAQLAVTLR